MHRTLLVAMAVMCGIIVGFLLGVSMAKRVPLGAEASVEWHWKRVNDYRAFIRDPKNSSLDSVSDKWFSSVTLPYDPEPSLLALANESEIYCADIQLPTVPVNRKINLHWMKYLGDHPDVLEASGLPESTALRISGEQPLYLKIWFKKTAVTDIQKLIDELEALASDQRVHDL